MFILIPIVSEGLNGNERDKNGNGKKELRRGMKGRKRGNKLVVDEKHQIND